MTWNDKISLSWSNLGRRKVRTALTSVGVIVGIMTVVTMVSLVNGVQQQVKTQFEKIGLDRVTVRPPVEGGGGGFNPFSFGERSKLITSADLKRWGAWPETQQVIPEIELPFGVISKLKYGNQSRAVRIASNGGLPGSPFAEAPVAVAGSLDLPATRGSIVLSRGALKSLQIASDKARGLLGQSVQITLEAPRGEKQSYQFKVIGVSSQGGSQVRVATADRLAMKSWWLNKPNVLQSEGYDSVTLRAADVSKAKILVGRLRKEKWNVQSIDAILEVADRIFAVITAMLALVSSVALLVACIGIVNTMIMSIYERTREIGTLKAMGASRGDIRWIFMIEAGLIGLIGGTVGLFSSWVLGRTLNRIAAWFASHRDLPLPDNLFIITPGLAIAALFFATLIGILAGLYPANRAASLDPLRALRLYAAFFNVAKIISPANLPSQPHISPTAPRHCTANGA